MATAPQPTQNDLPPLPADPAAAPATEQPTQEELINKKQGKEERELNPTPFLNYVVIGFLALFGLAIMAMIIVALVSTL